jgi:hypothetical protein
VRHRMIVAVAVAVVLAGTIAFAQQGRVVESTGTSGISEWQVVSCLDDNGNPFDVMETYEETWRDMTRYGKDGNLDQIIRTYRYPTDLYWNSVTEKSLIAGPGQGSEVRFTYENGVLVNLFASGGLVRVNVPGYGHIFIETGHTMWDANHQLIWNTGHNQYRDWDPAALEALCNALK